MALGESVFVSRDDGLRRLPRDRDVHCVGLKLVSPVIPRSTECHAEKIESYCSGKNGQCAGGNRIFQWPQTIEHCGYPDSDESFAKITHQFSPWEERVS